MTVATCTTDNAERIHELRERCLQRKDHAWRDNVLLTAQSLRASEEIDSWQVRRGLCVRDHLAGVQFALDDLEVLMGRLAPRPEAVTDEALAEARSYCDQHTRPGGQNGHCELDLSRLFELGIDSLRQDIRERMDHADDKVSDLYRSFIHALEGLSLMAEHAADLAASTPASSSERQLELDHMAVSCRRIAHEPPASFRDAIQLLWFADLGVMYGEPVGLVVPGHLDRTLWRYYESDLAVGALTKEDALPLIEQLYVLINELIPDGSAMSVMVGGRDAAGRDCTNELSYLCLEALRRTRLIYPTVGICWHNDTPLSLTDLAIELIGQGLATPAFFCDETIQRGLRSLGVPDEQACNYINSTCVEITPVGGSNVWVASPYFSLCKLLLDEIAEQVDKNHEAETFQAFVNAYHNRLSHAIADAVRDQNEMREDRRNFGGKPLQSVFTRDCIEQMRDIDDGGAVYNWAECSFVGLANLADSLHVIRHEVYGDGTLSLRALKQLLDTNFEDAEPVRQRFQNRYDKYGNGCPEVDDLVAEITTFCRAECERHRLLPDDSPFVPGAFCWIMHEQLGRESGATPDGRLAGFAFADGGGPAQGCEAKGPTAAILSTTSWDHAPMIGGVAYNMKFSSALFRDAQSLERLRELVLTFLRRGGFETQINVVDIETLRQAQANPEAHRDLIVRVGGYCDYFVKLSPQMQQEVMQRTEFSHV
jgi:trans-4-hydroxy-L-proline dehydratase